MLFKLRTDDDGSRDRIYVLRMLICSLIFGGTSSIMKGCFVMILLSYLVIQTHKSWSSILRLISKEHKLEITALKSSE